MITQQEFQQKLEALLSRAEAESFHIKKAEAESFFSGDEPVSYTHLDVYKRQEILCGYETKKVVQLKMLSPDWWHTKTLNME